MIIIPMKDLNETSKNYLQILKDRAKQSRVYQPHQMTGLNLAEILEDSEHKSLYMRLAKLYDNEELIQLAKRIAELKNVKNRGGYFMRMLQEIKRTKDKQ